MAVTLSFSLSFTIPLTSEDVPVKVGPSSVGTIAGAPATLGRLVGGG